MSWLTSGLSQECGVLVIAITVVIGIFIFAARKSHINHLEKLKKIEESFNTE